MQEAYKEILVKIGIVITILAIIGVVATFCFSLKNTYNTRCVACDNVLYCDMCGEKQRGDD